MAGTVILSDNQQLDKLATRSDTASRLARVALDDLAVAYSRVIERTRDLADDSDRLAFAVHGRVNDEGLIVPLWQDMMKEIGQMFDAASPMYSLQQIMTYGIYVSEAEGAWRSMWAGDDDTAYITFESTQAKALARAVVQRLKYLIYGTDPRTLGAMVMSAKATTTMPEFAPAAPETPDGEVINAN